jgi:hypothetical protein
MEYCEQSSLGSSGTNPAKLFCLLMLFALAGGIVMFSLAHAMERHGDDAVAVCNQPPIMQLINPTTDRQAHICSMPDGKFGVKIVAKDGDTITAFVKEKMRTVEDVVRYLNNRGYR